MRRRIIRFFRSHEWIGFIVSGYVVILISAFILFVNPHLTVETKADIYMALIVFFTSVVMIDLTLRCIPMIVRNLRLRRLYQQPGGYHIVNVRPAYIERCARALRDKWVTEKFLEVANGRDVPPDHLIYWDDWTDERNKNLDRLLAVAVVEEYRRWERGDS